MARRLPQLVGPVNAHIRGAVPLAWQDRDEMPRIEPQNREEIA